MSGLPRPLRFVGLMVGLWVAVRAVALAPDWSSATSAELPRREAAAETGFAQSAPPGWEFLPAQTAQASPPVFVRAVAVARVMGARWTPSAQPGAAPALLSLPPERPSSMQSEWAALPAQPADLPQIFQPAAPQSRPSRRFAGSAWLFVREGSAVPGLAPGGELGGSQAGLRMTYRLAGRRAPLSLSGRLYMPLERPQGAEAAVGLDWRPFPRVPINLLAERREALGRDGRSDFALTLYGGGERRIGPVRVEAWGQAGAVGVDDPDLFADGLVRATTRVGLVDVGGGIWGGAQPDASRLDAGPHVSARVPIPGVNLRLIGEYRVRIAGGASPGSGAAVTLASDF